MAPVPLLGQRAAQMLDVALMQTPGFSIDQLMELAGLSVACAIAAVWPVASRLLVVCGPGNNGGDALVASRHLKHFGYSPTVLYPRIPKGGNAGLYNNLLKQCSDLNIPIWMTMEEAPPVFSNDKFDGIVDGLFGFSFNASGGIRPPYDQALQRILAAQDNIPVASIDIPSGWDVEKGSPSTNALKPEMLISLTAPKLCSRDFAGKHHYLGGRFLPPALAQQYSLQGLPSFPGTSQCVEILPGTSFVEAAAPAENNCQL